MDAVVSNSRAMIRKGSRSFALASTLFDDRTREHAYMLYAWCRHCDDVIDGQELGMASHVQAPREQAASLAQLRAETRRALNGEDLTDPVFVAFQRVASEHRIPERHPLALLAGFEMDVAGHRYQTLDETLLYCYRVAGVVGVMMAMVMGVRDNATLLRAADLGIAFQLTNIARDVLDDARNGRCYLPADWLTDAGIPGERLAEPGYRPALAGIVARLLGESGRYYASAAVGLRALPLRSAWAIATALGVYRDIGRIVLEKGASAWDSRAVVSTPRKLTHVFTGGVRALHARTIERWTRQTPREDSLWVTPEFGSDLQPEPSREP